MKTTLDLPADLVRQLKRQAKAQKKNLADTAAEALRIGLARQPEESAIVVTRHKRTKLPLIVCRRRPSAAETLTPARVAEILSQQDLEWARDAT